MKHSIETFPAIVSESSTAPIDQILTLEKQENAIKETLGVSYPFSKADRILSDNSNSSLVCRLFFMVWRLGMTFTKKPSNKRQNPKALEVMSR